MRLLLVEDDAMIGAAAQQGLRQEGHVVDWVRDGREAETAAASVAYDLMLLDLGLPKRDGLAVLRALRAKGNALPVLIVTARDAVADRIAGLDAGADDYLVKPFDLDELAARVRAVARRRAGRAEALLRAGELEIDTAAREVVRAGQKIALAPREYALLEYLVMRQGEVVTRGEIDPGRVGIGAPLFDRDRNILGSLSFALSAGRASSALIERLTPLLIAGAREIERLMNEEPTGQSSSARLRVAR